MLKVTLLNECFSRFLNCTNSTKSRKVSHMLIIKNLNSTHYFLVSEAYLEINRTSKLEPFANVPNGFKPSTDFAESSVFDVRLGSESSEYNSYKKL